MPSLAEIRQQYPQYGDMPDDALADALYKKFYADMPKEEFRQKIGYQEAKKEQSPADTNETINAFTGGFIRDIPIVGPAIESGSQKAAAGIRSFMYGTPYDQELKAVSDYAKGVAERNPGTAMAGGVTGNVAALAPLGMTALGARAMGITGPTMLGRVGAGATSGAALGAADTAVRDGDIAEGTGIGAAAGALGPAVGTLAGRIVSPLRTPPERQALVNILENEGVPMTAGERTGNRPLRWMESSLGDMPGSGQAISRFKDEQGQAFTRAALARTGQTADLATPDVMQNAATRIGQQFEDLSARNVARYDPQFARDLGQVLNEYDRVLPSEQRRIVNNIIQDIVAQPGGSMPGTVYQEARSRLSRQAKALEQSDPTLSGALGSIRDALDGVMGRSIAPADQAAWAEARSQWGHLRTLERAMSGAGERTAEGYLSPQQLRTAVAVRSRPAYVRGHGDLADLARAGAGIMHPLPNSGTAPRTTMTNLATVLATGGGGAAGGIPGAIAGAATPGLLARALLSGPVQGYLSNQVGGQATQTALARALTGPLREAGVAISEDEKKRRQRDRRSIQ